MPTPMLLPRPRLVLLAVLAAVAAGVAAELVFRSQYPAGLRYVAAPPTEQPRPLSGAAGWAWPGGVPGFRFGVDEHRWNLGERLRPEDVGGARLRVLGFQRTGAGLVAVVAKPGCLGFVLGGPPARFACGLRRQLAFLIVARERQTTSVLGVARGDVVDVRLAGSPGGTGYLYTRWGFTLGWGAFGSGWATKPGAVAIFRDAHGNRLAKLRLPATGPALQLVVVR